MGLLFALLVFSGCSDRIDSSPHVGEKFPALVLSNLSGNKIAVPGGKKVKKRLVSIRTIGCRFCESDFVELEKLFHLYSGEELEIIAICVGFDRTMIREFLKGKKVSFTVLVDESALTLKKLKTSVLPAVYLLDEENRVTHRILGGLSHVEAEEIIGN